MRIDAKLTRIYAEVMKIFIFSTAYYPFISGAEVAIQEITNRLPEHEWHLFTARFKRSLPRTEKIGNVTVHRIGPGWGAIDKWWLAKWGGFYASRFAKKVGCDLIWSMMASWGGLAAWWFSVLNKNVPLVVTLQEGDDIASRKYGLVALGWRLILKRAKIVTVISHYLGSEARKYGYKGNVELVPNGIDLPLFSQSFSEEASQRLREHFGFSKSDVVLFSVSRLVEKNAHKDILDALAKLSPHIKFLNIAPGPLEQKLREQARNLNIENQVVFLGQTDVQDLPQYYAIADIFIRPSLSEGMGIAFLEAMAAQVPVIATPVGGIVDFLVDRETGYFCKPHDPESIAQTVQHILENPEEKERVGRQARALIKERYTWDIITPKMREAFIEAYGK